MSQREPVGGGIPRSRQISRARRKSISRWRGTAVERSASNPQKLCLPPSRKSWAPCSRRCRRGRDASPADDKLKRFAVGGFRTRAFSEAELEKSTQGVDHIRPRLGGAACSWFSERAPLRGRRLAISVMAAPSSSTRVRGVRRRAIRKRGRSGRRRQGPGIGPRAGGTAGCGRFRRRSCVGSWAPRRRAAARPARRPHARRCR